MGDRRLIITVVLWKWKEEEREEKAGGFVWSARARIASRAITMQRVINILVLITASPTPPLYFRHHESAFRRRTGAQSAGPRLKNQAFQRHARLLFAGTKEDTARGLGGPRPPQLSGINIGYFPIYRAFSRV